MFIRETVYTGTWEFYNLFSSSVNQNICSRDKTPINLKKEH